MGNSAKATCLFLIATCCLSLTNMAYSQGVESGRTYRIIARHSGKTLEVLNGDTRNGTTVQQATWVGSAHQKWIFTDLGDEYWRISPVHRTNAALRKSRDNVEIRSYADEDSRQWRLVDGGDGYYQIMAKGFNLCVTIDGS